MNGQEALLFEKNNWQILELSLIIFLSVFFFLRDEIGLIPCPEARYNRSPIVLVENKLGVESWCVKFLLPYVHNKLLLYRQRKQWLNKDGKLPSWRIVSYLILNTHFLFTFFGHYTAPSWRQFNLFWKNWVQLSGFMLCFMATRTSCIVAWLKMQILPLLPHWKV